MNKVKKCVAKETFQRMNYLYQISNLLATENKSSNQVSSILLNLLVNVSQKTVQRTDVNVKRSICKSCRSLLLAGVTCTVRIKKKTVVWTCINCNRSKIFETARGDHIPWNCREDSVKEILDYTPSTNK